MSDIIQLLPDHIANQIAAGEVVQRPASVVKELMENAIDANASQIRLIIKDAGRTLIQVIDDGKGMSAKDAVVCFDRHATSKISSAEDLFSIQTKGFRGEALASIAAIAQVELKTKMAYEELGTRIVIEGSKIKSNEACQTTKGSSIAVKNLFFNVPARRNFLKSNSVEMKHIVDEFQNIALAHAEVQFTLHHNNEKIFQLPAGNLKQRILSLFGNKFNQHLVPINEVTDSLDIFGFIGKPEAARKTRGNQFFFVNNRFIKSPYLNHAINSAFEDLVPEKSYPFYVIFFKIDPQKIDVNVHPTKQEIKFEDEKLIYNYLKVSIRHALAKFSITPSIEFDVESSISHQMYSNYEQKRDIEIVQSKANFGQGMHNSFSSKLEASNKQNWEKLYEELNEQNLKSIDDNSNLFNSSINNDNHTSQLNDDNELQKSKQLFQLHGKYIISPVKSGFLLFNQNAAHQRILYEKYLYQLNHKKSLTQQLLFPKTIELDLADANLLKNILTELNELGIDIKEFGSKSFIIHGLPTELNGRDEQMVIHSLIEQFKMNLDLKLEIFDNIARSLATQSAIQLGQILMVDEMQELIDKLFACEIPYSCPSGNKTFIKLEFDDLDRKFKT